MDKSNFLEKHLWAKISVALLAVIFFIFLFFNITNYLGFFGFQVLIFLFLVAYLSTVRNDFISSTAKIILGGFFILFILSFFMDSFSDFKSVPLWQWAVYFILMGLFFWGMNKIDKKHVDYLIKKQSVDKKVGKP